MFKNDDLQDDLKSIGKVKQEKVKLKKRDQYKLYQYKYSHKYYTSSQFSYIR